MVRRHLIVSPGKRLLAVVVLMMFAFPAHAAGNAEAGRQKAKMCVACHTINGVSARPDAPHLSGQVELYLAMQLRAYRDGSRKNEIMKIIAAPLTDEDIEDLAAWYASVPVTVEPVQ